MDQSTVDSYNNFAARFAAEWEDEQPEASDLHEIISQYFKPGRTLDVGCGSGRDTAWLKRQGLSVQGVDASTALVAEAKSRHPGIHFEHGLLPSLQGVRSAHFTNVFCETVVMHLPHAQIVPAVHRLASLLVPKGVLYLSWRVTEHADHRDEKGRLYTAFEASEVHAALEDATIELDTREVSASSGKIVHRIVATASPATSRT